MTATTNPSTPAPVVVQVDTGAYIEDGCPMSYDLEDTATTVVSFGHADTVLNLWLSEPALLALARASTDAAHAMLTTRSAPPPPDRP